MKPSSARAIRYQQSQSKKGLCRKCPSPVHKSKGKKHKLCLRHIIAERDAHAKRRGCKRQYANCASRRAEAMK